MERLIQRIMKGGKIIIRSNRDSENVKEGEKTKSTRHNGVTPEIVKCLGIKGLQMLF